MAIFSDKIIDVKFFDRQNTIIEVLYKENDDIISYALEVDYSSQDFLDLLEEYSLEDIEMRTYKKIREASKKKEKPQIKVIEKESNGLPFDCFNFLEKRFDEDFIFKIKTDMFKLEQILSLSTAKINKIKKSDDALELIHILALALK